MRRIQQYMTGSLFLMTLSAAAETWFSSKTGHGLVLSSHELLETLFPTALENIELSAKEYFPIFWGLATSTILQLPLWSIFAIATIYFSYLLMTDTSEIKRYGKDFENLEMWSRLAHGDSDLYVDRHQIHGKSVTDESIHTDNVKPALSTLDLLLDDEAIKSFPKHHLNKLYYYDLIKNLLLDAHNLLYICQNLECGCSSKKLTSNN